MMKNLPNTNLFQNHNSINIYFFDIQWSLSSFQKIHQSIALFVRNECVVMSFIFLGEM